MSSLSDAGANKSVDGQRGRTGGGRPVPPLLAVGGLVVVLFIMVTVSAMIGAAGIGLATLRDRIITTLSGGEQHRAHLARVLVQLSCGEREHGPGLLLLDEPTANLDLRHQVDFIGLTRLRARCGTAVVAVLHDLNLAAAFADRIIVLHGGAVVADGPARAAITTDMLGRVFDVCAAPDEAPADGMPFVLPQMMTARAGRRTGQTSRWPVMP
jgi:iron complex transport system ATP-binding protein